MNNNNSSSSRDPQGPLENTFFFFFYKFDLMVNGITVKTTFRTVSVTRTQVDDCLSVKVNMWCFFHFFFFHTPLVLCLKKVCFFLFFFRSRVMCKGKKLSVYMLLLCPMFDVTGIDHGLNLNLIQFEFCFDVYKWKTIL